MTIIILVFLLALVYGIATVLVDKLGWPTSVESAGKWGVALLVLSAVSSTLPNLIAQMGSVDRWIPRVSLVELLAPTLILGLTALGYHAWTRGASNARNRETNAQGPAQRRRALPPAPRASSDESFLPLDEEGNDE